MNYIHIRNKTIAHYIKNTDQLSSRTDLSNSEPIAKISPIPWYHYAMETRAALDDKLMTILIIINW